MSSLLLLLDLALPLALFFGVRASALPGKKRVMKDCLLVFCLALLSSPVACAFYSLPAQGILCAVLMLLLSFLFSFRLYAHSRRKTPEKS